MQNRALSITALLVAMASIQSGASVAKTLFPVIGAEGTTALRCAIASLILLAIFRPWKKTISRKSLIASAQYGLALAGMNGLFYLALNRIPLGLAVALEFTGPLALAFIFSRRALDFAWAILAVTGIILILPLAKTSAALDPIGAAQALGAGACWALYILFGQRAGRDLHGGVASSLGMLVAAIVLLPMGIAHAGTSLFALSILPIAVLVAIMSSAVPYPLEMIALKRLPTKTFGILMSLEPAIATLAGFFFLDENLTPLQYAAIACIVAASSGSAATQTKKLD